jgi:hypothetical protein
MELERSMFPQTLAIIERENMQEEYMAVFRDHEALLKRISPREMTPLSESLVASINALRTRMASLHARMGEASGGTAPTADPEVRERRAFVRKCPHCPDGMLSSQWRCPLCKTRVCRTCLAIKGVAVADGAPDPEHTCKPDDVESARAIEAETKPCPHCGVRVQKSAGCNQMWCVACNNAFDWRTGAKITGRIHNPHFHDYQVRMGAGAAVGGAGAGRVDLAWRNACDANAEPGHWPWNHTTHLVSALQRVLVGGHLPAEWWTWVAMINRFIIERAEAVVTYRPYTPTSHEDLRKRRLRGHLNDAEWARQLSTRETRRDYDNRVRLLDELIITVARDVIGRLLQSGQDGRRLRFADLHTELRAPMEAALDYYNKQSVDLAHDCGRSVAPHVDPRDWTRRTLQLRER